jgi:predicted branched-subunit amino acid permease
MHWNMRRAAEGLRDGLTFVPSVAILGAIFGASSRALGIDPWVATGMSLLVWSGSGQFAALPLWQSSGWLVVLSTLVLSLRFSLMTASMAPRLAGAPLWLRVLVAFGMTDENYALAISRRDGVMEPDYLAGAFLPLYIPWAVGTAAGAFFAAQVPTAWTGPLNAIFPMVFLALAVLCCTTRPAVWVAVLGAILAVVGRLYLPGSWYVVVAGLLASLAGPLLERVLGGEERS